MKTLRIFQGCFTVQLSRFVLLSSQATTSISYHSHLLLSTTFLLFLKLFYFYSLQPTVSCAVEFYNSMFVFSCQHFLTRNLLSVKSNINLDKRKTSKKASVNGVEIEFNSHKFSLVAFPIIDISQNNEETS